MPSRFAAGEACSQMSRSLCEPLRGSAPRVDLWLLLEYGRPWAAKILKENELSPEVNAWLLEQLRRHPSARLQFIKQGRRRQAPYRLYLIAAHPDQPRVYSFSLEEYDQMLRLDLAAILAGAPEMDRFLTDDPLFLVCTNSRRDPCCAKHGFPIYRHMEASAPGSVWQTTHLGGDRFAANILCFPHGLYFGRVDVTAAERILKEYPGGDLPWEHLRGRSCYDPIVQAAECVLRERLCGLTIDALELAAYEPEEGGAQITFRNRRDGAMHTLRLRTEQLPSLRYKNCRATEMSHPFCFYTQDKE